MDSGTWQATVHGVTRVRHDFVTETATAVLKRRCKWIKIFQNKRNMAEKYL